MMPTRSQCAMIGLILTALGAGHGARAAVTASKVTSSASGCYQVSGSSTFTTTGPGTDNGFGQWQSGSGTSTFLCPADGYSDVDVSSVTVNAWKSSASSVRAKVCVTYINGFGGTCGAQDTNAGTGVQSLMPSATWWIAQPENYRFLVVTMTGTGNSLFGYYQN